MEQVVPALGMQWVDDFIHKLDGFVALWTTGDARKRWVVKTTSGVPTDHTWSSGWLQPGY